jgi:hypothetical protein
VFLIAIPVAAEQSLVQTVAEGCRKDVGLKE